MDAEADPTFDDIEAAAGRIAAYVQRTPLLSSVELSRALGTSAEFKCENLQSAGAFKARGACNAVFALADASAAHGVATHSSGNHAAALARAARLRGIPAYIVMPRGAPRIKRAAVEGFGGRIQECEPTLAAREKALAGVIAETGAVELHPYDHPDVIAGQGTAALELLEDVPDLDAIVTPVGGGGLLAGCAIAATALRPGIRVFGAEPRGADDAARSKQSGVLVPQTAPDTIADGLLTSLGALTWPVIRDLVEEIAVVGEDEIAAAMRFTWERAKLLVEPSAAVAVAAVLSEAFRAKPGLGRVGIVISGGNVDLDRLPWTTNAEGT